MRKFNSNGMSLLRKDGETETWGNGYWRHPHIIRNVKCHDGVRRTIRLNQDADTYFSWPGRASFGKFTLRGFVSWDTDLSEPTFTLYDSEKVKLHFRKHFPRYFRKKELA